MSNPLALAVLAVLAHGPMHPYEMGRTLRERRNEQSIRLNYGSLYMVVDQLSRRTSSALRRHSAMASVQSAPCTR